MTPDELEAIRERWAGEVDGGGCEGACAEDVLALIAEIDRLTPVVPRQVELIGG